MPESTPAPRTVIIANGLAEGRFHLEKDDAFFSKVLARGSARVELVSSPESCARVAAEGVPTRIMPLHGRLARRLIGARLRYALRLLFAARTASRNAIVFFPAFYEPGIFLFQLFRRGPYYLVTHDNVNRSGASPVKKWLLRRVLRRADGVFAFSDTVAAGIRELCPEMDPGRVHVVAQHLAGVRRPVLSRSDRRADICMLGWARAGKGVQQFLDLAERDPSCGRYRYVLGGILELTTEQQAQIRRCGARIHVIDEYLSDEQYLELLSRSAFAALPYGREYFGLVSGVFCDAISVGTPVLAPAFPPYADYFDRYGRLGALVDFASADWIGGVDFAALETSYEELQCNLLRARAQHDPDDLGALYTVVLLGRTNGGRATQAHSRSRVTTRK